MNNMQRPEHIAIDIKPAEPVRDHWVMPAPITSPLPVQFEFSPPSPTFWQQIFTRLLR